MNITIIPRTTVPAQQEGPALNAGQEAAAEAFFQFLFSDQREMIISGGGGVGKTFLMGHLIDIILPRYFETCKLMGILPEYDSVAMTATTNKAAAMVGEATNRPTSTTHQLLNLKVIDDYVTGESRVGRTRSWEPQERKIIFIDENSMIDSSLFEEIRSSALNCKIVYVGDHCQLAPIKETLSPVFRQNLPFYELTEPMRTGIPELLNLNQQLRETVKTGVFKPIQIIPGIIDWLDDTQMQQELLKTFLNPNHNSRILAYTNQRVVQFNDHIRSERQLPTEWTVGETLVNNNAMQLTRRMLSVEEEISILEVSPNIETIVLDGNGAALQIQRVKILTKYRETFSDLPVPVDRAHYEALVKYYKRLKNWERFYHLKNGYPDFRPKDAATVHKAQGSTYDSVFIDVGNISTCHLPDQVARMLYVAASRAKFRVFFYGDLAEKYGGLVL